MRGTGSGWGRALLIGVVLTFVVALLLLVVPHLLVAQVPVGTRGTRVALAVAWLAASVVGVLAGVVRLARPPHGRADVGAS